MIGQQEQEVDYIAIDSASKELIASMRLMPDGQIRFMVDRYYDIQNSRKVFANQEKASREADEPVELVTYLAVQNARLERQIHRAMDAWVSSRPLGVWCKSIVGIGPVITAGLMAHINIERAASASSIWKFAGLDPTVTWGKGEKRPWNNSLKTLCFNAGECIMKFSNHEKQFYGTFYKAYKAKQTAANASGAFAELAAEKKARYGQNTDAYAACSSGRLPDAQIHRRACRYAVKMFLSHYHTVAFWLHYGELAPMPHGLTLPGHTHFVMPPNLDMFPELRDALIERYGSG